MNNGKYNQLVFHIISSLHSCHSAVIRDIRVKDVMYIDFSQGKER